MGHGRRSRGARCKSGTVLGTEPPGGLPVKLVQILLRTALTVLRLRHLAVGVVLALQAQCSPSATQIRCHNNADCRKQSSEFTRCVQQRCVQCATDAACDSGQECVDGRCVDR